MTGFSIHVMFNSGRAEPPAIEIGTVKSTEFTKAKLRVLRCLVKGMPYPRIAEKLNMERRVKTNDSMPVFSKTYTLV